MAPRPSWTEVTLDKSGGVAVRRGSLRSANRKSAAFCLARLDKLARVIAPGRRLTISEHGAQHTEKAVVFYYSNVKDASLFSPMPTLLQGLPNVRSQRHKVTFSPQ